MVWQDYLLSGVTVAFGYALVPQIIKGFKEKRANITIQTSAISTVGLGISVATVYTLDLKLTAALYLAISGL